MPMEVRVIASSSDANIIAVTIGNKTILIDVGRSASHTERLLLENGITPFDIEAIFITHAHGDHVGGIGFAKKYHLSTFASEGELRDIEEFDTLHPAVEYGDEGFIYQSGVEDIEVDCFNVYHNSYEPLGYTIKTKDKKASICLDTGHVCESMINAMKNSDIYVIEANYDERMLENSTYPESLKKRISGEVGHLSNKQTAEALAKLVQGKGEEIHLAHLSNENNMPALAKMTVEKELLKKGFVSGKHYSLEVGQ